MSTPIRTSRFGPARGGRGYTLVEAISTITIIAVVMALTSRIIFAAVDGYGSAATRAELHSKTSAAMERACIALRQVPLKSGTATPAPDIASVTPSSITWATNTSLSLSGSTLLLTEAGGSAQTLLDDVTAFDVATFDEGNTALAGTMSGASCEAIRRIRVTITVQDGGVSETLRTRVFIRALMAGGST